MKLSLLLIPLAVGLAACDRTSPGDTHQHGGDTAVAMASEGREVYTCPMHPSVISDKPGVCPICHMTLVKRVVAENGPAEDAGTGRVHLSSAQRVTANVATEPVRFRDFAYQINSVGVIDYAEPSQTKVTARFRGRIEKLYVNVTGELVRKGDPLFDIHSPDLVAAERDYALALAASSRSQEAGLLSAARERLRNHYGMTESQIDAIPATGEVPSMMTFTAPIHGTVTAKEVQEGQYVDEGMVLYQLADNSRLWAYLEVYEKDLRFLKRGLEAVLRTDAYPGESFAGKVTFIDPSLDPQTRTVRVRVELPNAGGKLKSQMYVRGEIQIPVSHALIVPASAILSTGLRDVVWVEVEPNTFEIREVHVGLTDASGVQILHGLKEGDMVATSGGFLIESESQLRQPAGGTATGTATGRTPDRSPMKGHVHD